MKSVLFLIVALGSVSSAFANVENEKMEACTKMATKTAYTITSRCEQELLSVGDGVYSLYTQSNACSILELKVDLKNGEDAPVEVNCVEPW